MRIHIANYEPSRIGGGWTFARNLAKVLDHVAYNDSNIYFIPSPSMVQRNEVDKAWEDGKKIILRIDNAVRNSRNRNTGMSRMYDFAQMADLVIFQSQWAKDYLRPFLEKGVKKYIDSPVILNGIDLSLYEIMPKNNNIIYSRFNRDETKNWEVARYWFSTSNTGGGKLIIVGNFSDDLRQYNFDFYNNEQYEYMGVLNEKNMAKLLNVTGKFLYTYYNDACSNSLIEALCAGCEIVGNTYYLTTGGAPEIIERFSNMGAFGFSLERMGKDYIECLAAIE